MRIKYKYLYRLAVTVLLLFAVPTLLFILYSYQESYSEIKKGNNTYYKNLADAFTEQLTNEIDFMQEHTAQIIVGSKKAGNALFEGPEHYVRIEHWYVEVIKDIADVNDRCGIYGDECKLFYYDYDCVLSHTYKKSLAEYINDTLCVKESETDKYDIFFNADSFQNGRIVFIDFYGDVQENASLLIGFDVRLGRNSERVMVLYELDNEDIKELLGSGYETGIEFYIFDDISKKLLVSIQADANGEMLVTEEGIVQNQFDKEITYQTDISKYFLSCVTSVTELSRQIETIHFFENMVLILSSFIIMLLIMCCIGLFFMYLPVYQLVKDLNGTGDDEFVFIRSTIKNKSVRIEEQENIIKDLLVSNLIYGTRIPQAISTKLRDSLSASHYCVFVLKNTSYNSNAIEMLRNRIFEKGLGRIYFVDVFGVDQNVIVAFTDNDMHQIVSEIRAWVQNCCEEKVTLEIGKVVTELEKIRDSYLSCEGEDSPIDEAKPTKKMEEHQKTICMQALEFIEQNFSDCDLTQTRIADELCVSVYALSRAFKAEIGVSYTDYVNSKRLERAKELLLTTDMNAQDIAAMVGYQNKNYFYRIFKATYGISISDFRKQ